MSSLDKLAIRGIRSFDDKTISVIEFFSPVTVIVGHNGSGKTTIIECLKYATTGDQPPNTRGGAFVHDPKMANEKEVKAQVKLRFHAANGTRMLAVRNLSVTVKKTSGLTMKTLESILSISEGDGDNGKGKRATISTKCAEMDAEIPQLLGVSKSVLENVIFCHQEESYWPLAEASALKKKFDDIFEATRYTKALDSIKVLRKDRIAEFKAQKEVLNTLTHKKALAERLKRRIEEANRIITTKEVEVEQMKIAYDEIHISNIKFYQYATRFREQYIAVQLLEEQKSKSKTQLSDMKMIMKTELPGTDNELSEQIQNFSQTTQALKDRQRMAQNRLDALNKEKETASERLQQIDRQQAGLEAEARAQEGRILERDALIAQIGKQHGIKGYETTPLPAERVTEFNERLVALRRQQKSQSESLQKTLSTRTEEYNTKLRKIDAQLSDLKSEKRVLEEKTAKYQQNVKQLNATLDDLQSIPGQISSLEREIDDKKAALRRVQSEAAEANNEQRIRELDVQKNKLEDTRQVLNKEMTALSRQADSRARVALKREETAGKSKELKRILEDCAPKYRRLVGSQPQAEDMENDLAALILEKGNEFSKAEKQSASADKDLNQEQSSLTSLNDQLKSKKHTIGELNQKLVAFDTHQAASIEEEKFGSVKEAVSVYTEEIDEVNKAIAGQEQHEHVYQQMLKDGVAKKRCTACDRPLDATELKVFNKHLSAKAAAAKSGKELEDSKADLESWTDSLNLLKPLLEPEREKNRLTSEIPEVERQIKQLTERVRVTSLAAEEASNNVAELKTVLKELDSLKMVANNVDRLSKEVKVLQDQIANLEADLLATGSAKTVDDVQQDLDDLDNQIRTLQQSRVRIVDEQTRHSNETRRYSDETNKMSYELADLQRRLREKQKVEEDLRTAKEENALALTKLKDYEVKVAEAEDPRRELAREHKATTAEIDAQRTEVSQTTQDLNRSADRLQSSNQSIQKYVRERFTDKLQECREVKDDADAAYKDLAVRASEATDALDALKQEVMYGDATLSNLHQNLQCRKLARSIAENQAKIDEFDMEEAAKAKRNFEDKYPKEKKKEEDLHAKLSRHGGELSAKTEEMKTMESDLKEYKNVYKEYTEQLIAVKIADMANNDLEKYAKALDNAIMKYHALKMEEVNDTMKHLWNKTYQGTDIDGIRIRSDAEGGATKRTYNYRVVMVKDQVEMDMRGRCSAGQKMLASIVIRLALSDSFGQNCGILALDEPTNALDTENIDALASSLVDIINERRNHSSFQLIIITHDEKFLRTLGQNNVMDFYWRISRDSRQKSVIERQRFI